VTYKDVDAECKLALSASLITSTNDKYINSLLQHLALELEFLRNNLGPGALIYWGSVSLQSL
jgi:hypothetical protein